MQQYLQRGEVDADELLGAVVRAAEVWTLGIGLKQINKQTNNNDCLLACLLACLLDG